MIAAQGGIFGWVAPSADLLGRAARPAAVSRPARLASEEPAPVTERPCRHAAPPIRGRVRPAVLGPRRHNAFFGLGFNVLVNVLVLTALCLFVVNIPGDDVFGTILPALGIALVIGNVYYT